MNIKRISHIGIAVADIDEARSLYTDKFGLKIEHEEIVDNLQTVFVPLGDTDLELLVDLNPDGVIARFIEKRGQGIQHVAYEVEDISQALAELKEKGVKLIDEVPRPGAHGTMVAFIHPKATLGVLTELVEYPKNK